MDYALVLNLNKFESALVALPISSRTRDSIRDLVRAIVEAPEVHNKMIASKPDHISRSYGEVAATYYKACSSRNEIIGAEVCYDPVWFMLLDLFMASEGNSAVTVTSLCAAAQVPPTTALRHMTVMERAGLLVRKPVIGSYRKVHIEPTARGLQTVSSVIDQCERASHKAPVARAHALQRH